MATKTTLVSVSGPTSVWIGAEISDKGDLVISGQDVGDAPREIFGDSDYEYWLTVPAAHKDEVILALLEELYSGDGSVISKLQALLESKGIPAEFSSYA